MKITLPRAVAHNPLVKPSRMRRAGPHGPTGGAQRQRDARDLRRELERIALKVHPTKA
jgi:hypothetical protein